MKVVSVLVLANLAAAAVRDSEIIASQDEIARDVEGIAKSATLAERDEDDVLPQSFSLNESDEKDEEDELSRRDIGIDGSLGEIVARQAKSDAGGGGKNNSGGKKKNNGKAIEKATSGNSNDQKRNRKKNNTEKENGKANAGGKKDNKGKDNGKSNAGKKNNSTAVDDGKSKDKGAKNGKKKGENGKKANLSTSAGAAAAGAA
ncbi:uncharacterized protein ColSpa_00781 [Colletotrichum spaethianum]|uniref:Uncharacterized protein n=1 Tax=Colletotrichum spaethianum TaxID=700344 RepID=A0AA37L715_9PEZI|nr:uncharacterized protein ColSpa_00781 [Colletotrichum spaethianum]GKT40600.1 hypothetical protein ColSpa_00781 [Colletotrichum spaethianum]